MKLALSIAVATALGLGLATPASAQRHGHDLLTLEAPSSLPVPSRASPRIDTEAALILEEAERMQRTGTALMVAGGAIVAVGAIAIIFGGLFQATQDFDMYWDDSNEPGATDVHVGIYAGGVAGVILGTGFILSGLFVKNRGEEMAEMWQPPVSVGLSPTDGGAMLTVSGEL